MWSGCCSGCGQDVVVGGDTSGCGLKAAVVTWIRMTHSRVRVSLTVSLLHKPVNVRTLL